MNIRKKLTIALLILSSFPLIAFSAINFYFMKNTAIGNALDDNLKRTEVVQEKVSALINENLHGLKSMANNSSIQEYDIESSKNILRDNLKIYTNTSSFVVTKLDGNQLVRFPDGNLTNIAYRNFFQSAIKGQEEVVSEILVSNNNGKLITVLATPIKDPKTGTITGIIQGTIELTMLDDFVRSLSTEDAKVYILDGDGKMLAHPTITMDNPQERTDLSYYQFVKDGLQGKSDSVKIDKDGHNMLVSYVQDKKTGWLICAEIPTNIAIEKNVKIQIITFCIGLGILFVTCCIVFVLSGYSVKPIQRLSYIAGKVSEGDLRITNIDIQSKDEIGILSKAFEKMIINLTDLINSIKEQSVKVSQSSKEMVEVCEQQASVATDIAESISGVADGTISVSSNIDRISLNMNILDNAITDIEKKSDVVSLIVDNASTYSEKGSDALSKVNSSMINIQQSVNNTSKVINKLGEHSKAIGNITEVIKGISEQTNLLALNAAIEAARAGENGKGFAVVADEVRKLAEQSGEAAGKVNDIVNGIQKETENAIEVMNKGINEVDDGSKVIDEASSYFELIFKSIQEISGNMKDVNKSVEAMNINGKAVFSNINDIVKLSEKVSMETQGISAATEEQVASIEEMTASVQEVSNMAITFEELTNKFKTN